MFFQKLWTFRIQAKDALSLCTFSTGNVLCVGSFPTNITCWGVGQGRKVLQVLWDAVLSLHQSKTEKGFSRGKGSMGDPLSMMKA